MSILKLWMAPGRRLREHRRSRGTDRRLEATATLQSSYSIALEERPGAPAALTPEAVASALAANVGGALNAELAASAALLGLDVSGGSIALGVLDVLVPETYAEEGTPSSTSSISTASMASTASTTTVSVATSATPTTGTTRFVLPAPSEGEDVEPAAAAMPMALVGAGVGVCLCFTCCWCLMRQRRKRKVQGRDADLQALEVVGTGMATLVWDMGADAAPADELEGLADDIPSEVRPADLAELRWDGTGWSASTGHVGFDVFADAVPVVGASPSLWVGKASAVAAVEPMTGLPLTPMYGDGAPVDYFCRTRNRWMLGEVHLRVVPADKLTEARFAYDILVHTGAHPEFLEDVATFHLRPPFRPGDRVEMFSSRSGAHWTEARVVEASPSLGVSVSVEEDGRVLHRVPITKIRRRFCGGDLVQVYRGPAEGFVAGQVASGAEFPDLCGPAPSSARAPDGGEDRDWSVVPVLLEGEDVAEWVPAYLVVKPKVEDV